MIEETEKLKRAVGQVGLYNIDWVSGRAEFGRLLIGDAEARGLGLARMATTRLINEGIDAWNLKQIHLEVLPTNDKAIAVYRACGFREVDRQSGVVLMQIETAQRNCLMNPTK